ncbi:hypothetical protein C8F01DRAFT_961102, partial [Mycena amicta]
SWLLDSAASTCISNNRSHFSTYTRYTETDTHKIIGIGSKQADGYGTVKRDFTVNGKTRTVTFERVLHLPSAPHNIISLGKL